MGVFWILLALLVCSPAVSLGQSGTVSKKLLRQIGVMEKIIGQVLVDSPNFLVSGRGDVRGTYLEEFGVLLTFEASLVGKDTWDDFDWRSGYRVETDKSGRTVIILPEGSDDDEDEDWSDLDEDEYDEDEYDEDDDSGSRDSRSWSSRKNRAERRLYARGKTELRDTLVAVSGALSETGQDDLVNERRNLLFGADRRGHWRSLLELRSDLGCRTDRIGER